MEPVATMEILPVSTVTTVTGGMLDVVTANIVPILGILAFAWGVKFVTRAANKSTKGRV